MNKQPTKPVKSAKHKNQVKGKPARVSTRTLGTRDGVTKYETTVTNRRGNPIDGAQLLRDVKRKKPGVYTRQEVALAASLVALAYSTAWVLCLAFGN
jgi:hypothetical protein